MFTAGMRGAFVALAIWLAGAATAGAESRLALVIGNSAYQTVPALPNPVNDAKAMAEYLKSAGFEVTTVQDATQSDMRLAIGSFADAVSGKGPEAVALVYYAGHGLQVDGENYLVPVDASILREADVPFQAIRLTGWRRHPRMASRRRRPCRSVLARTRSAVILPDVQSMRGNAISSAARQPKLTRS